jgi:twitching motility protein PilI
MVGYAEHEEVGGRGWRGVGFELGPHRLVVPLKAVREVCARPPLARVPGTKAWLLGVGQASGRLLPVTDLVAYLELADAGVSGHRVLVVERAGHLFGLAVGEVSGVRAFEGEPRADDMVGEALPPRLAECVRASAHGAGERWWVLEVAALLSQAAFVEAARGVAA